MSSSSIVERSTTYFVKGPVCKWNVQKMRSESSEYCRKTTGFFTNSWRFKIALENYFEKHAQEIWERNWTNPEIHTTLLNMSNLELMETNLKALQMDTAGEIAGSVPEISTRNPA